MLNPILLALIGVDVLFLLVLVVLAVNLRKLKVLVLGLAAYKPPVPSPAEIRGWKKSMAKYPEGSPKHTAYRNRLIQVGAIKDGD